LIILDLQICISSDRKLGFNLEKLKTPVKVIWGEKDFYTKKEMGIEFAKKANIEPKILSNLGHYPHLQSPRQTIEEIYAAFDNR
jgi:pimeloyl-ACP methyl ester carboxylesterase